MIRLIKKHKDFDEKIISIKRSETEEKEKNKSQNLVKQIIKLKMMNYFKGLGSYFDKVQRMRKLGGMISDELLIGKDKVEISTMICKIDLLSNLSFSTYTGTSKRFIYYCWN